MKFIRNRSLTAPAFLTMTYSQVTMYSFTFCLFIELHLKEKKKKKENNKTTTDNCIDPESNREPFAHQSYILPPD